MILRESQLEPDRGGADSWRAAREPYAAFLGNSRPHARHIDLLICALFAAIVTACIIQYSLRHGRLSLLPQYDDVGYMADGARRLQTLYDHGVPAFFQRYWAHPPHSPYSDLLAMGAFAVFGIRDWAPYAANFLLVLGLFASLNSLLAGVRLWQKVACFVLLASIPLVGVSVHEFRPDPCVGWLTAVGIMLALAEPLLGASRWRRQLGVGACFGVAMLVKPPFFPATVAFFIGTLVLATVRDIVVERRLALRDAARAWLTCFAPFVLIPLPHYLVAHRQIMEYIDYNMFGGHAALWRHRATLHDVLVYYGTGPGGQFTLGDHVYLLLGVWGVLAIVFGIRRRRAEYASGLAMGFALCMVYAQLTLNPVKSVYFGMTFPILLAFVVLYWLGRLLVIERVRMPQRRVTWASLLLLIATIGGIWLFHWPKRYGEANDPSVTARNAIANHIYHDVLDHTMLPSADWVTSDERAKEDKLISASPRVVLTGIGDLNADYLNYVSLRDRTMARWISPADTDRPEVYYKAFDDADFVIANESGTGVMADFLLNGKIQDQLLAAVRARGDFRQIGRYTFNRTGRSLYLFQRVCFDGFTPISGLGPTEGPYAEFNDHIVRWGLAPATRLRIAVPSAGVYQLSWWARNRMPGQVVTVVLDGQTVQAVKMPVGSEFTKTAIPLALAGGTHELALRYNVCEPDHPSFAILFRELWIGPLR